MDTTVQTNRLAELNYPQDFFAESQTSPSESWSTSFTGRLKIPFWNKPAESKYFFVFGTGTGDVALRIQCKPITTSATTSCSLLGRQTRVENNLLSELLEYTCRLAQPKKTKAAISTIKFNFSLNLSQLAEVLGVARPTVYAWLDEDSEVRILPPHQWRIERLVAYAELWWDKAARAFPKELFDLVQGQQLLSLLQGETFNDTLIRRVIDMLSRELPPKRKLATVEGVGQVQRDPSLTIEEIADS
ncbi:MAG: helix-turn-helix domain-containing protein [Chthoniobacterales bacterium]